MWTPELARVLDALLDAGASAIGQDLILPTSVEAYIRGYDRDYLLALRRASRAGKLVLGQVQHSSKPLNPFPGHRFAAGGAENLRMVNLFQDPDGVIRRIPIGFTLVSPVGTRETVPSFAVELAGRALGEDPRITEDLGASLGDRRLRGDGQRGMLINFANGGQNLPVYSLADLVACLDRGNEAYFRQAFEGKTVIIGEVLDVEDRKITSARFTTGPDGGWFAERCSLPVMTELYNPGVDRASLPGVFLFSTAVNNILRDEMIAELPPAGTTAVVVLAGLVAAVATLVLPLSTAFALGAVVLAAWVGIATILFERLLMVPLLEAIAGSVMATALATGYRLALTDRARRRIQSAFGYYLPPAIVDRLVAHESLPELGGEVREVTIFMSDVVGFTTWAEGHTPDETVTTMNRYFEVASAAIERNGGWVSLFVGDAIIAIFGAPLRDPDHARHAVDAALECRDALHQLEAEQGGADIRARTGLATGPALIGNIGSSRRFNYTAMGDTVNLAARLESANRYFGTEILISAETASRLGPELAVRPIERIRVHGREEPLMVYEPLGRSSDLSPEQKVSLERFNELARLRDRRAFADALRVAETCGGHVAGVLARHLRSWEADPSVAPEPVFDLPEK